jgi:hypothetical protein
MNEITKVEPASELRRIPLAVIKIDPTIQQRVNGTSEDVVGDYARAMRDGDEFPPPTVFTNDGITYRLADGFHRMAAYRRACPDVQEIQCEIRPGGLEDAVLFACGANASHGLRRTNEDKRKAVRALLRSEKWAHWSDREIARQCRVSHGFVSKLRGEHLETFPDAGGLEDQLERTPPVPEATATVPPAVAPRTFIRSGKASNMRTDRINRGRAAGSRRKNADGTPALNSLTWAMATKQEREKFVDGVGWREFAEAFNAVLPGIKLLDRAWQAAGPAERRAFAEERHDEIGSLSKPPEPAIASNRSANAMPAKDDDPLAIPTFLKRGHPDSADGGKSTPS